VGRLDPDILVSPSEYFVKKSLFQEKEGITVTELPFADGEAPPQSVVDKWLEILQKQFSEDKEAVVAVHCVAGLGRSPVLVAVALIEGGMDAMNAIDLVRKKRKGAINTKQIKFLEGYKPKNRYKCLMM